MNHESSHRASVRTLVPLPEREWAGWNQSRGPFRGGISIEAGGS